MSRVCFCFVFFCLENPRGQRNKSGVLVNVDWTHFSHFQQNKDTQRGLTRIWKKGSQTQGGASVDVSEAGTGPAVKKRVWYCLLSTKIFWPKSCKTFPMRHGDDCGHPPPAWSPYQVWYVLVCESRLRGGSGVVTKKNTNNNINQWIWINEWLYGVLWYYCVSLLVTILHIHRL